VRACSQEGSTVECYLINYVACERIKITPDFRNKFRPTTLGHPVEIN